MSNGNLNPTNDEPESGVIETVPDRGKLTKFLSAFLKTTGRANENENTGNKLGGKRDEEADKRAEDLAGKVLMSIEKGTQQNQAERNKATGENRPLTHAVSGHGKGTDQLSRVVHGRRGDEMEDDVKTSKVPTDEVLLTGNTNAPIMGKTPKYTTVGNTPSNTSGAFNTNQGMLHAVNEAFAQADQLSRHAEQERAKGRDSTLDKERFATNIPTDQELGYNLEVKGLTEQRKGVPLAPNEIEERYKAIEMTTGLKNAQVVLDPAYTKVKVPKRDEKGITVKNENGEVVMEEVERQVGWNLQTAYANQDAPTQQFTSSKDVDKSRLDLLNKKDIAEKQLKEKTDELTKAQKELDEYDFPVNQKKKNIERLEKEILEAKLPPGTSQEELNKMLEEATKKAEELDEKYNDLKGGGGATGGLFDDEPTEPEEPSEEEKQKIEEALKLSNEADAKKKQIEAWIEANRKEGEKAELEKILELGRKEYESGREKFATAVSTATDEFGETKKKLEGIEKEVAELPKREQKPSEGGEKPPTAGYNPTTGEYDGDRPEKPDNLKGTDEDKDPLTAHHIYPWNKIKDDLNAALKSRDAGKLTKLLNFGEVKVPSWLAEELKKEPLDRKFEFNELINQAAQKICWSPANIFMGPLGEKRGDDPGEELDQAYTKSRLPSPATALGELMTKHNPEALNNPKAFAERVKELAGPLNTAITSQAPNAQEAKLLLSQANTAARKQDFAQANDLLNQVAKLLNVPVTKATGIGNQSKLAELLSRNVREAQEGSPQGYDKEDWEEKGGKKVRRNAPKDKDDKRTDDKVLPNLGKKAQQSPSDAPPVEKGTFKKRLEEWQPTIKQALSANPPNAKEIAKLLSQAVSLSKPGGDEAEAVKLLTECHELATTALKGDGTDNQK